VKLEIEDYLQKMRGESGKNNRRDSDGYKRKSEEVVTIDDFSPLHDISKKKQKDGKKARKEIAIAGQIKRWMMTTTRKTRRILKMIMRVVVRKRRVTTITKR
jgi:hypothetical protein